MLDFAHNHVRGFHISSANVIHCGSYIVAVTPSRHDAERITALLNEHGLATTDDLEEGVEA